MTDHIKESFQGRVPWEIARLRGFFQNNDWHNMESVYEHTNRVLEAFQHIPLKVDQEIRETMQGIILQHDIGKIKPNFNGDKIDYPGHEEIGAKIYYEKQKLTNHLDIDIKRKDGLEFRFYNSEIKYEVILNHGKFHRVMKSEEYGPEWSNLQKSILDRLGSERHKNDLEYAMRYIRGGLIVLGYCDIIASDFLKNNPSECSKRLVRYDEFLNDALTKPGVLR